jgi:hypothetical protein
LSDESIINPPSADAERAPAHDSYVEMPPATPVEPEKKRTFEGDDATAAKAAAADLTREREAAGAPKDAITDRSWGWISGEDAGKPIDPRFTVSAERAADELKAVRQLEAASQQPAPEDIAARIDQARGEYFNQQAPQQPDPQTAQQQTQQPVEAQQPDPTAEIRQVLEQHPAVRQALESELQQTEATRAAYAQQARQAAQVAAAAVLSQWPSLANLSAQELPHAISAIAKTDPATAAQIQGQLNRVQSLYDASVQAQKAQEKIQAQQFQSWVAEQDAAFDREVTSKETPETMRKIGENVIALAEEYGVSKQELGALWQSQPLLRAAPFQRMMADAARYRMAQREAVNKIDRSVPPVQRPGTSQPRGDGEVTAALNKFRSEPSVANAAKLLQARRASNR